MVLYSELQDGNNDVVKDIPNADDFNYYRTDWGEAAAIIGNGTSRLEFSITQIPSHIITYGCNGIHRNYPPITHPYPDYVVAVDKGMVNEIRRGIHSDPNLCFPLSRLLVPEDNDCWEPAECNPNRPRMNAGMAAMRFAINHGKTQLFCFGFDFLLTTPDQAVSNIFDGSLNYGPETRANHADTPGRLHFLNWLTTKHPDVSFIFVFPENSGVYTLFSTNTLYCTYSNIPW